MNKIVREHYPAAKLPDDLREGIDPSREVTVTVVVEGPPARRVSLQDIFARRRPPFRTPEEIDADIRALRDEWEDRG
jgi:hypothetical protein